MKKHTLALIMTLAVLPLGSCASMPTHRLTFETNGGTSIAALEGRPGTAIEGEIVTTRDGYAFKGWYSDSELTKKVTSLDTYPYADCTIYAKWARICTITFETNGGTAKNPLSGAAGDLIDLGENPTKENSYFTAWHTDAGLASPFTLDRFPEEDLTLYALWENYPTISFVTNYTDQTGATVTLEPVTAAKGAELEPLDMSWAPMDKSSGTVVFDGWYSDSALTKQFYYGTMPDESVTLYAKWLHLYTITFDCGPGASSVAPLSAFEGEEIKAPYHPVSTSAEYFDGWYTDPTFSGAPFAFTSMPDHDLTLYAKWVENPSITFIDGFDETVIASVAVAPGTVVSEELLTDRPTHVGYHEIGWYSKDEAGNYSPYIFGSPLDRESVTVYLRFAPNVRLTFTGAETEVYELTPTELSVAAAPALADSSLYLVGWYDQPLGTDGKPVEGSTKIVFPYTSETPMTFYPYAVASVELTIRIGDSSYTVRGGAGQPLELPSEIKDAVTAYLNAQGFHAYAFSDEAGNKSYLRSFPETGGTYTLVEDTSFNPDIGI